MTDGRGTGETVNDGTSVGGGRGTEMESVVDRVCHWKGPEGPGRYEKGQGVGGSRGHREVGGRDDGLEPKGGGGGRAVGEEYSRQYGESLTRHSWFEPISARRGLGKPASRLTSLGELNWRCSLPEQTLSLWGPWHALTHLIAAIQPKLLYLQQCGEKYLQSLPQRCMCPNFNREYRMVAALQRRKLNMFQGREGKFSPRVLVRGNPARAKFAAENSDWLREKPVGVCYSTEMRRPAIRSTAHGPNLTLNVNYKVLYGC